MADRARERIEEEEEQGKGKGKGKGKGRCEAAAMDSLSHQPFYFPFFDDTTNDNKKGIINGRAEGGFSKLCPLDNRYCDTGHSFYNAREFSTTRSFRTKSSAS